MFMAVVDDRTCNFRLSKPCLPLCAAGRHTFVICRLVYVIRVVYNIRVGVHCCFIFYRYTTRIYSILGNMVPRSTSRMYSCV